MKLKSGVRVGHVKPPIVLCFYIIEPVLELYGQELVVTSICDGKHSKNSKHYLGYACDIRTWQLTENGTIQEAAKDIQNALGEEYYIAVESDHIHIQFNGLPS